MDYRESAAAPIRGALACPKGVGEKRPFGGAGLLLHGNMLAGGYLHCTGDHIPK